MNDTFWLVWRASVPILVIFIVGLLFDRREEQRRADSLEQQLADLNQKRAELVRKLALAQLDAAEAKSLANILRHRDEATCPCSEVKADRERIAYLTERNSILTLYCLDNSAKLMSSLFRN